MLFHVKQAYIIHFVYEEVHPITAFHEKIGEQYQDNPNPHPPTSRTQKVNFRLRRQMTNDDPRLHNSFHPIIRGGSTWSKFGARGEHEDVFLFSNLGAL